MTYYRPMSEAPRDREVIINTWHGEVRAYYLDCTWLRQTFEVSGLRLPGDMDVLDCWRPVGGHNGLDDADIELKDALGWRP